MSARDFRNNSRAESIFLALKVSVVVWGGGGLGRLNGAFPVPFHLLGKDTLTFHGLDLAEALASHQVSCKLDPGLMQALCRYLP